MQKSVIHQTPAPDYRAMRTEVLAYLQCWDRAAWRELRRREQEEK